MKVGTRRKSEIDGTIKTKEPCPKCKQEYLKQSYEKIYTGGKQKWVVIGKHCPSTKCDYCRKSNCAWFD